MVDLIRDAVKVSSRRTNCGEQMTVLLTECICRKGALGGEAETELGPSIDWVGSWEEVVVVARKLLPQEGHQVTKLGCVSVSSKLWLHTPKKLS
jgi:hypothetical protein